MINAQYQQVFVSECTCCVRHTSADFVKTTGRDTVVVVYDRRTPELSGSPPAVMNCLQKTGEFHETGNRVPFLHFSFVCLGNFRTPGATTFLAKHDRFFKLESC